MLLDKINYSYWSITSCSADNFLEAPQPTSLLCNHQATKPICVWAHPQWNLQDYPSNSQINNLSRSSSPR